MVIIVFFIILFIVLFFNSSFSRVATIDIKRYHFLSSEEIGQASEMNLNDHFFAVGTKTIEARVKSIPIIEEVKVTKSFPGYILIEVNEFPEVAFQISDQGLKEAVLANGSIVQVN